MNTNTSLATRKTVEELVREWNLASQGVWLEISLDGGGVKDEVDGLGRVALVDLEASR